MPQFNLLLLPLLGGFIFVSLWHPTKYYTLRFDGYRLVFFASIAGAMFMFLACVVITLASYGAPALFRPIDELWHIVVPYTNTGRAALAFLIGAVLWFPLNRLNCFNENAWVERVIQHKRDALEVLLRRAMKQERMVSVSMKSSKVYIGLVISNFNPAYDMKNFSLFPILSGYRHSETRELMITQDYFAAYEEIRRKLLAEKEVAKKELRKKNPRLSEDELESLTRGQFDAQNRLDSFEIAIPVAELQSVNIFDVEVYEKHFRNAEKTQAAAGQAS